MSCGNFPRQYRWLIVLAAGISLIWGGCTQRPLEVKTSSLKEVEKEIDTMQALYSVDLSAPLLLSRANQMS